MLEAYLTRAPTMSVKVKLLLSMPFSRMTAVALMVFMGKVFTKSKPVASVMLPVR
jgi:hypothetical protein